MWQRIKCLFGYHNGVYTEYSIPWYAEYVREVCPCGSKLFYELGMGCYILLGSTPPVHESWFDYKGKEVPKHHWFHSNIK